MKRLVKKSNFLRYVTDEKTLPRSLTGLSLASQQNLSLTSALKVHHRHVVGVASHPLPHPLTAPGAVGGSVSSHRKPPNNVVHGLRTGFDGWNQT